jgi:hypothetical protein
VVSNQPEANPNPAFVAACKEIILDFADLLTADC